MDWELKNTSLVILGAGFSVAATDNQLPLMRTFFDQLERAEQPTLYAFIQAIAGNPAKANVEAVLLALDQIRTSPERVIRGWGLQWKQEVEALRRELATYTLARLDGCHKIPEDSWAAMVLAECGQETTVISMNYDNVAEIILSNREGMHHGTRKPTCPHCKMRRLMQLACSCAGKQEIGSADWIGSLLKLHGSIAWKRCLNPNCCSYECLVADARCMPFEPCACPHCEADCGPVLVMPTMNKNLNDIPEIGVMWEAAYEAICAAKSILLFGFSMPTSDELLTQMIRAGIHANRTIQRVASIDINPEGVLQRFERCIPDDMEIEATAFKVVPGQTPDWLPKMAVSD